MQIVSQISTNHYGLSNTWIHLAVVTWLSTQLGKQKRNDFKPRNDDISFARVNTEPCEACCESLERVRDFAKRSLGGKNLEIFLTEIGVAFHTLVNLLFRLPSARSLFRHIAFSLIIYENSLSVRLED